MVAAGAVVTPGFEVPAGSRVQGLPARLVPMKITPEEIRRGARSYRERAAAYPPEFWARERARCPQPEARAVNRLATP